MRKLFPKLNISRQLLSRGVSLVVVFTTLVTAYAALSMNATLGWFAKNEKVTASGMITQAYAAKFEVTIEQLIIDENGVEQAVAVQNIQYTSVSKDETGEEVKTVISTDNILANVKVPGQYVTFRITVKNIGVYSVNLTGIGLEAPGVDDDLPKFVDGQAYYLSTQLNTWLRETSITTKVDDEDVTTNLYTTTPSQSGPPDLNTGAKFLRQDDISNRINYMEWLKADPASKLTPIELKTGDTVTFVFVVHFKDDGNNQNAYKNFGELGVNGKIENGQCRRSLFITWDD